MVVAMQCAGGDPLLVSHLADMPIQWSRDGFILNNVKQRLSPRLQRRSNMSVFGNSMEERVVKPGPVGPDLVPRTKHIY